MKFEQLLRIYWSKTFLYGGRMLSFNNTLTNLFESMPGLSYKSKMDFIRRFELNIFIIDKEKNLLKLDLDDRKIINMYLSQLISINNNINELIRYNLIRLYLIKTYRARAQALGKPSHGQRTWSNASNAYHCNKILRLFISEVKKHNVIKKVPEKINFQKVKKKLKKSSIKIKMTFTKKKANVWF